MTKQTVAEINRVSVTREMAIDGARRELLAAADSGRLISRHAPTKASLAAQAAAFAARVETLSPGGIGDARHCVAQQGGDTTWLETLQGLARGGAYVLVGGVLCDATPSRW